MAHSDGMCDVSATILRDRVAVLQRLPESTREQLDVLLERYKEEEEAELEKQEQDIQNLQPEGRPRVVRWRDLKASPGAISLESVLDETDNLRVLSSLSLPEDLFDAVSPRVVRLYRERAAQRASRNYAATRLPLGTPIWPRFACNERLRLLSPYILLSVAKTALCVSVTATLLALLIFGSSKRRFTGTRPIRRGLQTALIGELAAAAAFLIARAISEGEIDQLLSGVLLRVLAARHRWQRTSSRM